VIGGTGAPRLVSLLSPSSRFVVADYSVADLTATAYTDPVQFEQVVRHANQRPFALHFLNTA
jgi:hypothetical protein